MIDGREAPSDSHPTKGKTRRSGTGQDARGITPAAPGADLRLRLMAAYEHFLFSLYLRGDSFIAAVTWIDAEKGFARGPSRKAREESRRVEGPYART